MSLEYPLGSATAEALIYYLENFGTALVAGKASSYTLEQVDEAIKKVLGDEAGALLMTQLVKILEEG